MRSRPPAALTYRTACNMDTSSGSAPQVTRAMIAIRSRDEAVAPIERSHSPSVIASNLAALGDDHGSLMLTVRAIRANCHWMRPMSSTPIGPSVGMVPV